MCNRCNCKQKYQQNNKSCEKELCNQKLKLVKDMLPDMMKHINQTMEIIKETNCDNLIQSKINAIYNLGVLQGQIESFGTYPSATFGLA